jgi:predicted transcriptional regulator
MAIFSTPKPVTVDVIVDRIKAGNTQLYNTINQMHTQIFKAVWEQKNFTPKQIVDAFGTDAKALFELSSAVQTLLKTANPLYEPLVPKKQVTINENGTVTVAE